MVNQFEFKAISREGGNTHFVNLSEAQEERIPQYTNVLQTAARSEVPKPIFSNYFVKVALVELNCDNMTISAISGGNIEYGLCQAQHAEESVIAAFRSVYKRKQTTDKFILGIISGEEGNVATPCGNCRDIIIDELGTSVEIVTSAPNGKIAVVAQMSDYLFDDYKRIGRNDVPRDVAEELESLVREEKNMLRLKSPLISQCFPERVYIGMVKTPKATFKGFPEVRADYHPIYPLRAALTIAENTGEYGIENIVIIGNGKGEKQPHVMYKDRQHLLESSIYGELIGVGKSDPPVYLVTLDNKTITGVWCTTAAEWLPLPFSLKNFGSGFVNELKEHLKKISRQ